VDAVKGEPYHPYYCFMSALLYMNWHAGTTAYQALSLVEFPNMGFGASLVSEKPASRKLSE
jgi:hypothetical protein